MIVIDSISCLSARMSAIIHSNILHTSFRMVCWPPYCPMYYTCEYYNTYVYFCPYIENFPLYLLMKIGSKGRRPARRRVGSGASPAAELPLWSKLRKFLPSVDTERRNGYNISRVRPKRSAALSIKCYSQEGKWPPCCSRAALFFSYGNRYRFNIAQPSDKKCKQFLHKPHLLSDGVLTAAYPVYYTCRYYNAYV